MIPADRSPWIDRWFRAYTRAYLRRAFYRVHLHRQEDGFAWEEALPVVVCMNHSSWWDLLIGYHVGAELLGWECYAPMEARQLERYRFLRRVGVFGIERGSPRGAREFLDYAESLLRGRRRALWLTPQGAMLSTDRRPIRFRSGLRHLARRLGEFYLMPAAIEYEFWNEKLPEAFVALGGVERIRPAEAAESRALGRHAEARLTRLLDALSDRRRQRDPALFTPLLAGRPRVSPIYDTARRVGAWWRGLAFTPEHEGSSPLPGPRRRAGE